jgi:cytochrome P450
VQTAQWWLRPLELLDACARRYGDPFTLRLSSLGDIVVVSAPDLVKRVFTGDPDVLRAGQANEILKPIVGPSSVLLLDGKEHLRHRRLLTPPFVGERMAVYADIIEKSTLAAVRGFPVGEAFSLHPAMAAITLDVILHAIFGLDDGPIRSHFAGLLTDLLRDPPSFLLLLPALRIDAPLSPYRRFLRARGVVDRALYQLIDERRRAADLGTRKDVLSLLLAARDEAGQPMSDEEVHDDLLTLMVAGHETTATSLAWTFERLLSEPEVLARATAEVEAVLGRGSIEDSFPPPVSAAAPSSRPPPRSGEPVSSRYPTTLPRFEYLDAILKETLRLRPIIPVVGRLLSAPFALAGYTLPAGTAVWPCIHLAQRRADTYAEPERFWPDRWLGARVDPYAWLPFGGGVRRCIGMGFALYEMKVILATVLAHARLRPASPVPERTVRRAITMFPAEGTQVVMTAPTMA